MKELTQMSTLTVAQTQTHTGGIASGAKSKMSDDCPQAPARPCKCNPRCEEGRLCEYPDAYGRYCITYCKACEKEVWLMSSYEDTTDIWRGECDGCERRFVYSRPTRCTRCQEPDAPFILDGTGRLCARCTMEFARGRMQELCDRRNYQLRNAKPGSPSC